jgi:hypothetical protein
MRQAMIPIGLQPGPVVLPQSQGFERFSLPRLGDHRCYALSHHRTELRRPLHEAEALAEIDDEELAAAFHEYQDALEQLKRTKGTFERVKIVKDMSIFPENRLAEVARR